MRRSLIPLIVLVSFALVPQPNHQAVLITGDTPEGARAKVEKALDVMKTHKDVLREEPVEDTLLNSGLWGLEQAVKSGKAVNIDEFWNDTYLMWELLYNKGWPDDHIQVLYGDGKDYQTENSHYQASRYRLPQITDRSAYYADVVDVFSDLANGDHSGGIDPMGPYDNLFVWTFDHGEETSEIIAIDVSDPSHPIEVSRLHILGYDRKIRIFGNYAYVVGYRGLDVIDISDPNNLRVIGTATKSYLTDIDLKGNYGYVSQWSWGFEPGREWEVDVSDPYHPQFGDSGNVPFPNARSVECGNIYSYVSGDCIDQIAKMKGSIGAIDTFIAPPGVVDFAEDLELFQYNSIDSLLFLASRSVGIRIVRASNMEQICHLDIGDIYSLFASRPERIYATSLTDPSFYIFEMIRTDDSYEIKVRGSCSTLDKGIDVFVDKDRFAYVADGDSGLTIIDVEQPSHPYIEGNYYHGSKKVAVGITKKRQLCILIDVWQGFSCCSLHDG